MKFVIKVEINTLIGRGGDLDKQVMDHMTMVLANLCNSGFRLFIISSGAIFLGARKLGRSSVPGSLVDKQAFSAVGQAELVNRYRSYFETYNIMVAQVLLTGDLFKDPERKACAASTLKQLADMDIVPVINENDAVSTEDIELDDNYYLVRDVAELTGANGILVKNIQPGSYSFLFRDSGFRCAALDEEEIIPFIENHYAEINSVEYLGLPFPEKLAGISKSAKEGPC